MCIQRASANPFPGLASHRWTWADSMSLLAASETGGMQLISGAHRNTGQKYIRTVPPLAHAACMVWLAACQPFYALLIFLIRGSQSIFRVPSRHALLILPALPLRLVFSPPFDNQVLVSAPLSQQFVCSQSRSDLHACVSWFQRWTMV
jgi:hypothetical protein